jgi:4-diphosphocytidyl-2-C-methyl-D-erythritol kinase
MTLEKPSPCKVNLLLNILGKRPDGFHELETLMHPIRLCDQLRFEKQGRALELTCSDPTLPVDRANLVHRAATAFLERAGITDGVRIHLEKRIPLAAGLGGGSGDAATTLLGLNELFGDPLSEAQLREIAATLGSDIPFFLQNHPALATGRGEVIQPLGFFPALKGAVFVLVYPGFGVPTAWAYRALAAYPEAIHGRPGRARSLIESLQSGDLPGACAQLYNSLEAPVLQKYPLLALYQEFAREHGALGALMSGSGSTTFALAPNEMVARRLEERLRRHFGPLWAAVVPA